MTDQELVEVLVAYAPDAPDTVGTIQQMPLGQARLAVHDGRATWPAGWPPAPPAEVDYDQGGDMPTAATAVDTTGAPVEVAPVDPTTVGGEDPAPARRRK